GGVGGRLGSAEGGGDDGGGAAPRGGQVAAGVRLAGEVGAPEEDEGRVLAHVLLGVHLQRAGEAQAEGAQAPADHGRRPPLAAVEVGEAAQRLGGEAGGRGGGGGAGGG